MIASCDHFRREPCPERDPVDRRGGAACAVDFCHAAGRHVRAYRL